jgi:N-acetylmuramoyl-L-alanine amidase
MIRPGDRFTADSALAGRAVPAVNFNERRGGLKPDILLLHYTGMPSAEAAIRWLAAEESGVSCHYVIDEAGAITQMVPERLRAWHAGVSFWDGVEDINSCSIGIEIQNPGHNAGYTDFPDAQMAAVEALCLDIIKRHAILPWRVLAHSDVAPKRKIDPGEKFAWSTLARAGAGHWVEPVPIASGPVLAHGAMGEEVLRLQLNLRKYGYGIPVSGTYDEDSAIVVSAFQRHFRPALVDGRADVSTAATLDALLAALPSA